jgi:hypothetical protein
MIAYSNAQEFGHCIGALRQHNGFELQEWQPFPAAQK